MSIYANFLMTLRETSIVTFCSSKKLTEYTGPVLSMINKLGCNLIWYNIWPCCSHPVTSQTIWLYQIWMLPLLLTDPRILLCLTWSILGCYLLSFPVGAIKFASHQLLLLYLVVPFLIASRLFLFGIKTHSSLSAAKKTKKDVQHISVLFTGTV